ncbi:DUF6668 family protein [Streptomyces tauricus]|uniref:DUF6668 family protein n=1 Tax=Streptomyces tauricus TaxID=68274 RepID=UPI0022440DFB|nr:DUF6668 family protein [Streptomyces tauricus]MCW8103311.1 hypothetical protein [Streptomyces tauricus]
MTTSPTDANIGMWVRGPVLPVETGKKEQLLNLAHSAEEENEHHVSLTTPLQVHPAYTPGRPHHEIVPPNSNPAVHPNTAQSSAVSWVNAHGGAGATTFAAALGGVDVGQNWPDLSLGNPGRFFLLARTHAAGLQAASRKMEALRSKSHPLGIELIAIVLVADAPGRLPSELSRRIKVVRSAAPSFIVPWIPAWRVGQAAERAPRPIVEIASIIQPNLEFQRKSNDSSS